MKLSCLLFVILLITNNLKAQIIPDGVYQIYSDVHQEAMVTSLSGEFDVSMTTPNFLDNNQLWNFSHQGGNVYKISNVATGSFIGIKDGWCGIFGDVQARYASTDANIEFLISKGNNTGSYVIQIAFTTCNFGSVNVPVKAFDVQDGNSGAQIQTFDVDFGGANQQFRLISHEWNGNTDSDWANTSNWTPSTIPSVTSNVRIPDVTNKPIINANASLHDILINTNSSLQVNNHVTISGDLTNFGTTNLTSNASLILNGLSTGNITFQKSINFVSGNSNGWHLMSSPVSGQVYNNSYATANDLAISSTRRGLATYATTTNTWSYLEDNDSNAGTFTSGTGYSIKRGSTGAVSFTGTINTADVSVTVSNLGSGFNLLGNPYTSHVNSTTFLTDNTANLVSETIWVWDQATNNYETHLSGIGFVLAPTQGFFVQASNNNANLTFAELNQAATGGTFQKSARTEVKLQMNDGTADRFVKMYYLDNATKGFDNGFDGETFGGIENNVDVFTNLLENNEGKKFQVQSLPISEMETMIVPVGVKAAAGKQITFTAEALNLPGDTKVFLEDRLTNTVTRLDEANASYKVTLNDAINGTGRFYLHTKATGVLSTDDVVLQNTSVYAINNNTLRVVGLPSGNANVKMYSILGKQVMQTSFSSTGVKEISLPKLSTGMYIIQVETAAGKLNKKIVLE